jgi:hypothetical protein
MTLPLASRKLLRLQWVTAGSRWVWGSASPLLPCVADNTACRGAPLGDYGLRSHLSTHGAASRTTWPGARMTSSSLCSLSVVHCLLPHGLSRFANAAAPGVFRGCVKPCECSSGSIRDMLEFSQGTVYEHQPPRPLLSKVIILNIYTCDEIYPAVAPSGILARSNLTEVIRPDLCPIIRTLSWIAEHVGR